MDPPDSGQRRLYSLTAAITCKYLDDKSLDVEPGISFSTLGGGTRNLLYERSEKLNRDLRALENRTEIDLQCCWIGSVGDSDHGLFIRLRNVLILDVSYNFFESWSQIAEIVDKFYSLKHIIVTGNLRNLVIDEIQQVGLMKSFRKLKKITLGKMLYDWKQIIKCSRLFWPDIEELDVFCNNITEIERPPIEIWSNLTTLILDENEIVHWKYINNLGYLERLETLKLVNCGLESVEINQNDDLFPNLIHLDLKSNRLSSWRDIASLNNLKSLDELIIRDNPLFEDMNFDYAFNFTLSIIGHLKVFNRQQITSTLRKDGEIHYLRFYYLKYLKAIEMGDKTFLEENPRYLDIIQEYGVPPDLVPKNNAKPQSKLITLNICDSSKTKIVTKKIPRTTTIETLKMVAKKLLSIERSEDVALWVNTKNDNNQEVDYPLDREEYNLDYYSIKENDYILVKPN